MAAGGLAIGGDLAGWLRPLTYAVFALVLVSLVLVLFGSGGSAFLSLAAGGLSHTHLGRLQLPPPARNRRRRRPPRDWDLRLDREHLPSLLNLVSSE
jgi:hypothetical protein